MSYTVKLSKEAEKDLKKLDNKARKQVVAKLEELKQDPRHNAKTLKRDPNTWSRRVGDYRILYEINKKEVVVTVIRVGHRKEVYDE